jgi:prepilin-type N-terminal cleavage/methylation domain-containing protein
MENAPVLSLKPFFPYDILPSCGYFSPNMTHSPHMKNPNRFHQPAFTLIELLAVITIIVILAGIVVGSMGFVNEKQSREKAKVQIGLLEKAIEEYKLDMGGYPGSTSAFGGAVANAADGDFSQILYTALFSEGYQYTNPTTPPSNWGTKATKIYLSELDPRNSKMGWVTSTTSQTPGTNLKIVDPWGNNYRYRAVGSSLQNPGFDLWSRGKDNKHNTSTVNHAENRDDIRNF